MSQPKDIKELAKRIDQFRKDRGLSYQKMANACGMDKAQVYKICTEGVDLRVSSLVKIANGLGISVSKLLDF